MNISGKISGISYNTLLARQLKEVHLADFDINTMPTSCILADGENVFIFLDPPYYSAEKSALYGRNGNMHKGFDHQRFA